MSEKKKLFDFTFLKLVSAHEFLSYAKAGFWVWLFLYLFSLIIFWSFGLITGFASENTGIDFNTWRDSYMGKDATFWIVSGLLMYLLFSAGVKAIIGELKKFFKSLSYYPIEEIILGTAIFGILPWIPFLFLPSWIAIAFPWLAMCFGGLIVSLEKKAMNAIKFNHLNKHVNFDSIIENSTEWLEISSKRKKALRDKIVKIYSQETWESQISEIVYSLVDAAQWNRSIKES